MKALEILNTESNEYNVYQIPAVPLPNQHIQPQPRYLLYEKRDDNGSFEVLYKVTLDKTSPKHVVPNLNANYDRISVLYDNRLLLIIWSREQIGIKVRIPSAVYQKNDGKLEKVGTSTLPLENIRLPIWKTHHGNLESQILVKDVWYSSHSGEISPIVWEDDIFDAMEDITDFNISRLETLNVDTDPNTINDAMEDALKDMEDITDGVFQ